MAKSSDPIVLCLQNATDSRAFELLCSDILAGTDFPSIEPIGGTGDGGRDALYRDDATGLVTVCAFSVREDWQTKLREDCARVKGQKHKCNRFLFATSMPPTPAERDKVVAAVREEFGWELELYGRERLASIIRGKLEHLLERHPGIFPKAQFRLAGGRLLETSHREILLIDHVNRDQAFAHWVARCLRLVGYDVWCRGIDSTSGEVADTAIRELLRTRARHHLPIISTASVRVPEFRGRVEQSAGEDRRLLPLQIEATDLSAFSANVRDLDPVLFENERAKALRMLVAKLEEWSVPKDHEVTRRRRDGLCLPSAKDLTRNQPETLLSNVFSIPTVPNVVQEWRLVGSMNPYQTENARQTWPFVISGQNLYSFMNPPAEISDRVIRRPWNGVVWRDVERGYFDGKNSRDLVSELLRRTLEFAFFRVGLLWCADRKLIYFCPKEFSGKRLPVKYPDGTGTARAVCGEKHKWRPNEKGEDYNWQLAPDFRCYGSFHDPWEFRTRVILRVTYRDGTPIESKRVIGFRRHAAGGWNQAKFRDLNLLFMQHLAPGESTTTIGAGGESVMINTMPHTFVSPMCIDEAALPKGASKFAKRSERIDDDTDEDGSHE